MNHLGTILSWLTLAFEAVLCGLLFANRVHRLLPFFAAYASTLLANTVAVWLAYQIFGFRSLVAYFCFWISVLLNAVMRSLAIAELCRYKLRAYRGIWGLVWRMLIGLSILFLLHAAFDTWGQPNRLAIYSLTLDRDLDIASVAILAALLTIHNYYGLSLDRLQKAITAGICFISAVDVINDTILRTLLTSTLFPLFTASRTSLWFALQAHYDRISDLWNTIHLICFMATMGIWCYALRRPISTPAKAPVLLPAEVYRELSPAINLQLSAFNDRLVELLKP
jgi:hypothetical protein